MRILSLLTMVPLLGCDGTGDGLRPPGAATDSAAPLASDTSVVTTRRVWSSVSNLASGFSSGSSTIMPNGTGLATIDWDTADPAVFDLATQEFTRFRVNDEPYDPGQGWRPLASPDGSKIAFEWLVWQEEPGTQLRVVDVATGESRTLLALNSSVVWSLSPGAWTPAGDSLFAWLSPTAQGSDVEVVLIPVAGGTPRLVHTIPRDAARMIRASGDEWRGSLSPDGRWLLYAHELSPDQRNRSDIYVIDVHGGGARPLLAHPAHDLLVGWLPGTDVVLFSSDRSGTTDLWGVRVVNGRAAAEPRLVRSGFFRSRAVGFGDGALFYRVETGSRGPAVINVDAQTGELLGAGSPPLASIGSAPYPRVAWSPDGETLAAIMEERGVRTVTLQSMETGESRAFRLDDAVRAWRAEWAADGNALFLRVTEDRSSRGPTHFLRLDLVTGTTTRLFAWADSGGPDLSFCVTPDGRSIVLRQRRTRGYDRTEMRLVLRSIEDGSERELHRTSGVIQEFRISADGTQLAFVQESEDNPETLFVMRMDGSQSPRAVASWDHAVSLLGWLPAGNTLLAARPTEDATGEEILRVELDGSTTVVGIKSPFQPAWGRSRLLLSPAGNRLVDFTWELGSELWRMDGLPELFANDATGRR